MNNATSRVIIEQIRQDRQILALGTSDSQAISDALMVMILTPHIREYLFFNDPQALEQARKALGLEVAQ